MRLVHYLFIFAGTSIFWFGLAQFDANIGEGYLELNVPNAVIIVICMFIFTLLLMSLSYERNAKAEKDKTQTWNL